MAMITAQIEPLADCLEEMKRLFPAHWEELAIFKDKMPLAPQYRVYWEREAQGELVMAILRKDGRIVGYFPTFVAPGLHYGQTLTATGDIIWLDSEERGYGNGKLLMDCLETELRRRGVKLWWVGSKNHRTIEKFFRELGFEPAETYLAKWIGD